MSLDISRRSRETLPSEIRNMTVECLRAGGINLAQGVCDTPVPRLVRAAAQAAIDAGVNSYTRYDGLEDVRRAIAGKLRRQSGLGYDPENEIVVSVGSTGAFHAACLALIDPGDEVILFEPFYGYHHNTITAIGARPAYVPLSPPDWTFDDADLEAAFTPRTKAIVICSPANPSGKVFTQGELERIARAAISHDVFVFTDEIYEYFLYDDHRHISPATLLGLAERTVTISGYSKTFSITGWRIGFAAAPSRWAKLIGHFSDLVYVCAPSPLQRAVALGITGLPDEFYDDLRREYDAKRARLCDALASAGLEPHVPQGAYYVLADASRLEGSNAKERAMRLLERTGVASVPGSAFFRPGRGDDLLRFCFAKTDADLDEACRRLTSRL